MIFDSHAHLVSDDLQRYPPAPLSGTLDRPLDDPLTAEKLLRLMDQEGVERAVAVQRAHVYGYDNRYVCDAADSYPDRLVAVCCINADADDAESRARHWLLDRGAVGLRLTEPRKDSGIGWFASEAAKAVWRLADDLHSSICLHMYRWNRAETLAALPEMLRAYPQVTVVVDHASNMAAEVGPPNYGVDSALSSLVPFANVFQKLTAINFTRLRSQSVPLAPVVSRLVEEFGAGRVMWGSDVAQSPGTYPELISMARDAVDQLTTEDRQRVLKDTGSTVFRRRH